MEKRVLYGLQDRLLDPKLVAVYVAEYQAHRSKRSGELNSNLVELRKKLHDAEKRVANYTQALGHDGGNMPELIAALKSATLVRDAVKSAITGAEQLPVVALHPAVVADYRRQIAALNRVLAENPESNAEAVSVLRSLIDRLVIFPTAALKGVTIQINGKLAAILSMATGGAIPEECMVVGERVKGIEPSS